jgi:hypothetical protein
VTDTLTRWWTPEGKVKVEDLLKPGTDPHKDLGLGLLALHRAGAEACELVAKTAIADEHVLIAALAETRQLVAPLAVETIAKAVEGPQYAGLLLRDLLDDAEIAALALYRTCLSKSVAPPIAAQRVGMVYGVSSRGLNRYAALASDPKSNPVAVQDLADRTLFDYVAKVVAAEYVPAKETVSKAPSNEYEAGHNVTHDSDGQFARLRSKDPAPGLNLQALFDQAEAREAAPKVGAQEPVTTKGPQVGQPRQMKRLQRMKRMERPKAEAPVQMSRMQLARQSLASMQMSRQELALQELVPYEPTPMPLSGMPRSVPDLRDWSPPTIAGLIDKPVSFVMTDAEFNAVARAAGDTSRGTHVMRLGPLEQYAGEARLYEEAPGVMSADHQAGIEHVLDVELKSDKYRGHNSLIAEPMDADVDLSVGGLEQRRETLCQAKEKFLAEQKVKLGLENMNVASQIGNVEVAVNMQDKTQTMLIWRPPPSERSAAPGYVKAPAVVELVAPKNVSRGSVHNGRVQIDGSTPVQMRSLFSRTNEGRAPRVFWDPHLEAIRTVVVLDAAAENDIDNARWNTGKADSGEQYLDRHNVRHGERGQFVREQEILPGVRLQDLLNPARTEEEQVAAPPRKMVRMARMKRMQRAAATPPLKGATQQLKTQKLGAQHAADVALAAQKLRTKHDPGQNLVHYDPMVTYTALDPYTMDRFVRAAGVRNIPAEDINEPLEVNGGMQHVLFQEKSQVGYPADLRIRENAFATWNGQAADGQSPPEKRLVRHTLGVSGADPLNELQGIAEHLESATFGTAAVQTMRVKFTKDPATGKVSLVVFGNETPMPAQHLFRYAPEANPDRPRRVTPDPGVRRTHDAYTIEEWLRMTYHSMDEMKAMDVEDELANARVKTWLVE